MCMAKNTVAGTMIPGMRDGEVVVFTINGVAAISVPLHIWGNDWSPHEVSLIVGSIPTPEPGANQLWLPLMLP